MPEMPADLQARVLEATSRILAARDAADPDANILAPTAESAQPVYPLLETALRDRGTDPASVKNVLTDKSLDRPHVCWAIIEYYKAILELPPAERELFLKYKFAK
jgi:hypothetical protein